MPRFKVRLLFTLLPMVLLATVLTVDMVIKFMAVQPTPAASSTPLPTATPLTQVCQVTTGIEVGALNLRACGSTSCTVVLVIREGEPLTPILKKAGWVQVQTQAGTRGWVNSEYLTCEVTK